MFQGRKKRQIKSKSPLLGLKTKTFLDSSVVELQTFKKAFKVFSSFFVTKISGWRREV